MKTPSELPFSRREFLRRAATATGGLMAVSALATPSAKRTAVDLVPLGQSGLRCSRLGIGTGSHSGRVQCALGHEGFNRLIRHVYDQGVRFIDTAQSYRTHSWIKPAIKGLPRENLFLQTKISGNPSDPLKVIDQLRKELDTDYLDSVLVHCTVKPDWNEGRRRVIDALAEARSRGWLKAGGVSCHSLPALKLAADLDWVRVNLVRLNPQGVLMDTPAERWNAPSNAEHVPAVVKQVRRMQANGHGVIGMKIIGEGRFTDPAAREKSIRWVMQNHLADAVVIGFKSPSEVDEAIERINRALAET